MRIVGLDLGTSAIKAVLFQLGEQVEVEGISSHPHPLSLPFPGQVEQDADTALGLALEALRGLNWEGVQALSVSAAMHSLLALDSALKPLMLSWTWADVRSAAEAAELRQQDPGRAFRCGTPIHPMAWPSKLLWMRRHRSRLFKQAAHFVGLKEYVLHRLTGGAPLVMDRSMASATGCYNLQRSFWEVDLGSERFPRVVPTDTMVGQLQVEGLPQVPVFVGAGDGPLSNWGSGATHPGCAALSIGTSGALRVTCQGPRPDPEGRVFCYHLAQDWWVRGGAISNGTLAVEWLRELTGGDLTTEELVAEGCAQRHTGLVFLPYLSGERAPHWNPAARGVFFGLSLHHRRPHLARAVVEGIAFSLREVLEALQADTPITEIRASGGLTRSQAWMQLLADVLELPVSTVVSPESAALGAALLAARALGQEHMPELPLQYSYRPAGGGEFRQALARYRALYPALEAHFG